MVAGLRITGSAQQPRVDVFAEPAMSQEQALSYLILGRPLGSDSGDNNLLARAAIGLGLAGSSRLLEADTTEADETIADALEIKLGEPVVRLRRLRLGNGAPIGIQTAHLPASLVPGLVELSPQLTSLYEALRSRYGILPKEAREAYRVGSVLEGDAELLGVPSGSPAFVVERVTYDVNGPFEFAVSTMRGDRYEIRSKLYL